MSSSLADSEGPVDRNEWLPLSNTDLDYTLTPPPPALPCYITCLMLSCPYFSFPMCSVAFSCFFFFFPTSTQTPTAYNTRKGNGRHRRPVAFETLSSFTYASVRGEAAVKHCRCLIHTLKRWFLESPDAEPSVLLWWLCKLTLLCFFLFFLVVVGFFPPFVCLVPTWIMMMTSVHQVPVFFTINPGVGHHVPPVCFFFPKLEKPIICVAFPKRLPGFTLFVPFSFFSFKLQKRVFVLSTFFLCLFFLFFGWVL